MKRSVAICRNRASACTIVRCSSADRAVVTEHLLDLGATARDVAQPTGREREHRRAGCEHDERRPPLGGAVEDGGARGDDEGREREAGDADRDVDREHVRGGRGSGRRRPAASSAPEPSRGRRHR